ncbi:indolepyruvate ferredoxin oxidoreductase subunit alpha [Cloacibacillus evryensis]|uniref:indolepyruvate ferredoxin oxidoreductase subunit alpha n=1 Tax=Cloacibacillus evryensis TaxID=508460 RepID=UPI0004486B32|nr:indolepyruvate ferredoxin oxidoreductase subunit alpha [Cloacibacillus evryensis]EXG78879.1 indolepyruvate ferredoxin oxidoreductase, alpha subunit [Cloacibacillus evryensis DSM 19522]MCQ4763556.1 indolepyruvate ferredoxin oxidoreductase subunit alpha [Cloacibacillus evryensis]MEA5034131.1 indolepyruvate ferredoxin oxidoreductase subunit alpha [Cloacibacillus evryensis]
MKKIMTGNEAIARGAWEAGLHVAAAYPGTPSTEILENLSGYKDVYSEWATNEKVALEVAAGASMAGARALAAMKHVGLNVAADPLFTLAYTGVGGGLVVVTADDPGLFSSQNEQDNRFYASHAKLAMIEPSDSQESLDFIKEAFAISENFDTPVLFRVSTRICHSKTLVEPGERAEVAVRPYEKNSAKYVMAPAHAKKRKYLMEKRIAALKEFSETTPLNRVERGEGKTGIITSGISYNHAKEVFGDGASYLKLGFTWPLPEKKIRDFAASVDTLYVIEENEPYIEDFVKALGVACTGREKLPWVDELTPEVIRRAFFPGEAETGGYAIDANIPPRPPVLCAGCTHRGFFYEVGKYKDIVVTGDIGCYTLGMVPPLSVTDSVICMGASVSAGVGFRKAVERAGRNEKVFAVIGDSTFFHSGITGLIDAIVNKAPIVVNILDNRITAMTGHQENPGTGRTLMGEPTHQVDLKALCMACGVKEENIRLIDPYDLTATKEAIKAGHDASEPFVIITTSPCALIKEVIKKRANMKCAVDEEKCVKCKLCLKAGCPALNFRGGRVYIDRASCNGCTVCMQICPKKAISREGE